MQFRLEFKVICLLFFVFVFFLDVWYIENMKKEMDLNLITLVLESNNVQFAGVFGSVARGEDDENSDIDILVKFKKSPSLLGLIRIEGLISEKIGRGVDLVTEDSLSPLIRDNVLHDLKLFYGKR
jgi:predicted nucleotidyltransferase